MIFSRLNITENSVVKINNRIIKHVQEARFLGVIIDEKLTCSAHIKGAGWVPNLGLVKIEFSIVLDRGEPQLPDAFYQIKKY